MIASVDQKLGYKLPAFYICLMKQHNGGIPVNTCFLLADPAENDYKITPLTKNFEKFILSLVNEAYFEIEDRQWLHPLRRLFALAGKRCAASSQGHGTFSC